MARVTITVSDRKDGRGVAVKKVVTHLEHPRRRSISPALLAADMMMASLDAIPDVHTTEVKREP